MDKVSFDIQMKSLRSCVEHLNTLDLAGMQLSEHASPADRLLIFRLLACLPTLPP